MTTLRAASAGHSREGLHRPGLRPAFGLLLAEEPFDGLDPPSREALDGLLAEAAAGGAAVVVATRLLSS